MLLLLSTDYFFSKLIFARVSNGLDPDLGPNCLQSLSADNRSRCQQGNSSFTIR